MFVRQGQTITVDAGICAACNRGTERLRGRSDSANNNDSTNIKQYDGNRLGDEAQRKREPFWLCPFFGWSGTDKFRGSKTGTGRLALRRNWKDCGFAKVKSLSFGGAAGGKKQSLFERGRLSVKLTPVIFVLYNIIQI